MRFKNLVLILICFAATGVHAEDIGGLPEEVLKDIGVSAPDGSQLPKPPEIHETEAMREGRLQFEAKMNAQFVGDLFQDCYGREATDSEKASYSDISKIGELLGSEACRQESAQAKMMERARQKLKDLPMIGNPQELAREPAAAAK
jgi:hypothetical protein